MLYLTFYTCISVFLLNFISAFTQIGRVVPSSLLIDKKLYFSGGLVQDPNDTAQLIATNEFFYLDVSKSFSITNNSTIPWNDLTYTNGPLMGQPTACIGGKNNDAMFVLGGLDFDIIPDNVTVDKFDIHNQNWTTLLFNPKESKPKGRSEISCAAFKNGLIAIFSGFSENGALNDLWIFDTIKSSWILSNAKNAPPARLNYQALTLPDQNILYIGGGGIGTLFPMNQLLLYDTTLDEWKTKNTTGETPQSREFFSAVLTSDGRIIIFGGTDFNDGLGDLWILDIEKFHWSIGKISNPIANLTLYAHTATLVNDYMFLNFGRFNQSTLANILILDVSNPDAYRWVDEFTPNT